jgi:addiction module HigA family antidote
VTAAPPRRPRSEPLARPRGVPARAPLHPGRFLQKHYLGPLGISQTRSASLLGISRRRLNEILQGKRSMTPDTAIRCALAFRADVAFWLALQTAWDSFHAWKRLRAAPAPAPVFLPSPR